VSRQSRPVLFCLYTAVQHILFCLPCFSCSILLVSVLPVFFLLEVLSWQSRSSCPILTVVFWLSCSSCPVLSDIRAKFKELEKTRRAKPQIKERECKRTRFEAEKGALRVPPGSAKAQARKQKKRLPSSVFWARCKVPLRSSSPRI
jgi:hypothetical protein